jgi:hypothetical protein
MLQPSQVLEYHCHMNNWPKRARVERQLFEGFRVERLAQADFQRKLDTSSVSDADIQAIQNATEFEFKGVTLVLSDSAEPLSIT